MNKEELEYLILVRKMSYEEIGRREGLTGSGIKKRAKKYGINIPQRRTINPSEWTKFAHRKNPNKICPICGKVFRPYNHRAKYCSVQCATVNLRRQPRKLKIDQIWDGQERKDMWEIGKIVKNHGYLYARCPQHPSATSTGYVYLHRIVVENHIGRLLRNDEVIHHKDWNKLNNDINNLVVLSPSEHAKIHASKMKERGVDTRPKNPARGKNTRFGRFDEGEIKEIRRLAKEKIMSRKEIAKKYGVTKAAIKCIIQYKTYKWVA